MRDIETGGKTKGVHLEGNGITDTRAFDATGVVQVFWWAVDPGVRILSIYVRNETGTMVKVLSPGDLSERIGTLEARLPPGRYYLSVASDGRWSIIVMQAR